MMYRYGDICAVVIFVEFVQTSVPLIKNVAVPLLMTYFNVLNDVLTATPESVLV